jgi:SpoVK/Ycf46/Vps4 family AAA+-type ATPase
MKDLERVLPPGILDCRKLPTPDFDPHWQSIILPDQLKESMLNQAALNFTVRSKVPRSVLPLHGIILLTGAPGTGKTTIAKGLANQVSKLLSSGVTFIEIEPHGLASSAHGKTQRAVSDLFGTTIAEHALGSPTIVLLDEVETILVDRTKLSLEANPIDVHRATDAALVALDHLAADFPNLLIVATSNFPQAIDSAFVSRCDSVFRFPIPSAEAAYEILKSTLEGLSKSYPAVKGLVQSANLHRIATSAVGLDGRQLRKVVAMACAMRRESAVDPGKLNEADLGSAIESARVGVE